MPLRVKFFDINVRWTAEYSVDTVPRAGEKVNFIDKRDEYEVVDVMHYPLKLNTMRRDMQDPTTTVYVRTWNPCAGIMVRGNLHIVEESEPTEGTPWQ